MSALGANRTRRDGGNDVNDPELALAGSKSRSAVGPADLILANAVCSLGIPGSGRQMRFDPFESSRDSSPSSSYDSTVEATVDGIFSDCKNGFAREPLSPSGLLHATGTYRGHPPLLRVCQRLRDLVIC